MNPADNIEKTIKQLHFQAGAEMHDRILGDVLEAYGKSIERISAKPLIWRKIMKSRATKFAAAAVVIIAVLLVVDYFTGSTNGTSIAFADVLEKIQTFRPYICTSTTQYEGEPAYSMRVMRSNLTRRREIRPDGSIYVFDLSEEPVRMLILYPDKKLAIEKTLTGMGPAKDPDLLRILSAIQDGNEEDLGVWQVEGRTAQGFHVPDEINDWTVWVDSDTGLPIRIELVQQRLGRTIIMDEFEFDVDLDESLFSVAPPEGYTVKKVEKDMTAPRPTEQDLIEGLRAAANFMDGEFPPEFEPNKGLIEALKEHIKQKNLSPAEIEEMTPLVLEGREKIAGAWKYIIDLKGRYQVRNLRYAGKGVKLGDAKTPVMWWRFKGSETYRAIYGDLSVRDVPMGELPAVGENQEGE